MTWNLTRTVPYEHQRKIVEETKNAGYWGLFAEQGTGKTFITIAVATHLWQTGQIDRLLIIAPNGVHINWTRTEIPKHCVLGEDEMMCAHWQSMLKKKDMAQLNQTLLFNKFKIVSMNIEALRTKPGLELAMDFLSAGPAMMVVDESTSIKNHKSLQAKACFTLARYAKIRWILTGTPITQNPTDLFGQCWFLSPDALGIPSFTAFKAQYALEKEFIFGPRRFRKIVGFRNLEDLGIRLRRFSTRVLKDECLDLPDRTFQTEFVELTVEQRTIYDNLKTKFIAELKNGGFVSVTSALQATIRFQQIVSGFVHDTESDTFRRISSNRLQHLIDLLDRLGEKAIVWCNFVPDVTAITSALGEIDEHLFPISYFGGTPAGERIGAVETFNNNPKCRWFVCTSAASKGLTLVAARYAIYYSRGWKLEDRLQSLDRIHRIGQTRNVTYIDLVSPGTIDERIAASLIQKQDLANKVMDLREIEDLL